MIRSSNTGFALWLITIIMILHLPTPPPFPSLPPSFAVHVAYCSTTTPRKIEYLASKQMTYECSILADQVLYKIFCHPSRLRTKNKTPKQRPGKQLQLQYSDRSQNKPQVAGVAEDTLSLSLCLSLCVGAPHLVSVCPLSLSLSLSLSLCLIPHLRQTLSKCVTRL